MTTTTQVGAAPERDAAPGGVRGTGAVLLVGGLVGAVVSLVLLVERIALLSDPLYSPSCSIDAVLACGSVMQSDQASVLGFPNPIIGLATFPVAATLGALLVGGTRLPRWCWLGLVAGTTAGVVFVHWLIAQSLVVIGALCPWCMVAWVAVIAMFWFVIVHVLVAGYLGGEPAAPALARRHGWGLAAWYLLVLVAVIAAFPAWAAGLVGLR